MSCNMTLILLSGDDLKGGFRRQDAVVRTDFEERRIPEQNAVFLGTT